MSIIVYIGEVGPHLQDTILRVYGKLIAIHLATNIVLIQHDGCTLEVNIGLVGLFEFHKKSWYQFIGTLKDTILIATVVRCVDSLDQTLFKNALTQIRKQGLGYQRLPCLQ